jgi:hypothetical protein
MRSIKTIVSCSDGESCFVDTPRSTAFHPTFHPSFQPSILPTRKPTVQDSAPQQNLYTKYGYVNNNISNEFTSSVFLKKMGDPFKSRIEDLKVRARKERTTIRNMIIF